MTITTENHCDRFGNYLLTANGAKTCLELTQKISGIFGSIPYLGWLIGMLSLWLVPEALKETWESLSNLQGENLARKSISAVRTGSDALLMSCSASSLFSSNPAIERVSSLADSSYDSTDLYLSHSDYLRAEALENLATGDAREVLTHSKNYYFLRICRAVISITAAVFSLFLIAFSSHWIWGATALTLSILASTLSIVRDIHKESGPYQIVTFDLAF